MKETPSMVSRSSNFSRKKIVSIIVLIEKYLNLSDPIFKLLKSKYPASLVEVFFTGKTPQLQKNEAYKRFQGQFKSVKTVTIKSFESIYSEVVPLTRGEICLFTSGDCSPEPHWIKRMADTFVKDDRAAIVLGSVQQRRVDPNNKIEQYCEQIGWGSIGEIPGDANDSLTSTQVEIFEDGEVNRAISLLRPVNMAVSRALLLSLSKNFVVLDMVEKLRNEKLKLFYNPAAEVERFHSMSFKEIDREIKNDVSQNNDWLSRNAKRISVQIHFFGKWQWSFPFLVSINFCWGDFHWLNLFGLWILSECFINGFSAHFGESFWFSDEVLLLGSVFGFFSFKYFLPVLKIQPWSDFILWCWVKYRTNMSMFLKGLWTGLKFKCFYWGESW
jgi:hypothetical protein